MKKLSEIFENSFLKDGVLKLRSTAQIDFLLKHSSIDNNFLYQILSLLKSHLRFFGRKTKMIPTPPIFPCFCVTGKPCSGLKVKKHTFHHIYTILFSEVSKVGYEGGNE